MINGFQQSAFQNDAFQIGVAAPAFPNFNLSGGGRRWYIVKTKRLYLTNEELAWYLARELVDAAREDIKVTYKTKAPRVIATNAYNSLMATVRSLETFQGKAITTYDESDDEDALILLM